MEGLGQAVSFLIKGLLWTVGILAVLCVGFCSWAVYGAEQQPQAYEEWCGLPVEPENRCSKYDREHDYSYPASIEWRIAERAGYKADRRGWLDRPFPSPYMAHVFVRSIRDTDIEHIVAAAEAHDSGLCTESREVRTRFARDFDNLTLSLPSVNRFDKSDKDAAEWMPEINREWYARTIVGVKRKYGLAVDAAERDALAKVYDCREGKQ